MYSGSFAVGVFMLHAIMNLYSLRLVGVIGVFGIKITPVSVVVLCEHIIVLMQFICFSFQKKSTSCPVLQSQLLRGYYTNAEHPHD